MKSVYLVTYIEYCEGGEHERIKAICSSLVKAVNLFSDKLWMKRSVNYNLYINLTTGEEKVLKHLYGVYFVESINLDQIQ